MLLNFKSYLIIQILFIFYTTFVQSNIETTCEAAMTPTKQVAKIISIKQLGPGPMETLNPFLFCVYHKDDYPAGDGHLQVPNKHGNGQDFNPTADYRMYHGDTIPGFPQHPHRGFETITATLEGLIDHTDSLGNAGRYGEGDLQWMTAGRGVVHGENFPLINENKPNPLKLFQIWLNLPKKNKLVDPDFVMHWKENIKHVIDNKNKAKVTVYAGEYNNTKSCEPTKNSWAREEQNEVGVLYVRLDSSGTATIPAAKYGEAINRALYIVEGKGATINSKEITRKSPVFGTFVQVDAAHDSIIEATQGPVEVLMLQGRPILGEKVVQHGPFVMNSQEEIMQTFQEYQRTRFGGWPWDTDAVVFPKDQGRFAKINGKTIYPPNA